MEGVDPTDMGAYSFRLGTQLPNGQLHWKARWLLMRHVTPQTMDEMYQVMEDAWTACIKATIGIQQELF
jgi:hypothetical protein